MKQIIKVLGKIIIPILLVGILYSIINDEIQWSILFMLMIINENIERLNK